jgi:hypothetical protein
MGQVRDCSGLFENDRNGIRYPARRIFGDEKTGLTAPTRRVDLAICQASLKLALT